MRPLNIMIVDDHRGVRALIRELLCGCLCMPERGAPNFAECRSGEEAVDRAQGFDPDLVTVDLRMEGMGGWECIRRLRALLPRAALIVVTGLKNELAWQSALRAGANRVLLKDDLTRIEGVVRDWILRGELA